MKEKVKVFIRKLANRRAWAYGLFWSWNIIFLAFMFLGFGPQILPEMITAVQTGTIPTSFLVYAVVLTAIPAVMVILGLTILRRSPGKLFTLGYGVEGPLMLLVGIRFFVVRDATPAITLLLTIAGLGMAAFLWQLIDRSIDARGSLLSHLRVIGLTLLLVAGLYTGIWIAFYAVPIAVEGGRFIADILRDLPTFLSGLWDALTIAEWQWIPFMVLGAILWTYTATLFIGTPIAVPILCIRAWRDGARALSARHGRSRAITFTLAVLIACAVLFVWTNRQPQHQAFAMLEQPPASIDEAQALLERQETIRAGLLNSYLAPVRYVSAVGEVRHVRRMYQSSLDMPWQQAVRVQELYEAVARPLLYAPVNEPETDVWALRAEPVEASELYEDFFDQPIVEGERETIVRAVRSTWSVDQAMTGWLAVDDREVHLEHQEVTVTENGDWAEIELYEIYRNQTGQRHEVVYYFSLPESAVITGVWLGNSADRDARFAYRVAPRGAAQAIYRNELRRNVDPALVEQIGPRQYRLRIFPVEPQDMRWDDDLDRTLVEDAPPLHMWLTWRALTKDNAWPLPRLAERRNIYWDDASTRLVNGEVMVDETDDWLPESVPAASPVAMVEHRADFPGGESVLIRPASGNDLPTLPGGLRIALVLDRSRSMAERAAEVEVALAALAETADSDAAIDVYLTASAYRGEGPERVGLAALDPGSIVYYGGQNAAELLAQFDALHAGQRYDVVLVLTDDSGYDLGEGEVDVPIPDAPTWMVHLGGDFPLGYDDATLEAIQASGGGVVGGVEEALARLSVALGSGGGGSSYDVIDGYVWTTVPTEVAGGQADDAFAPLAARQLILSTMHRHRDEMDRLETLDNLHAIAVEHSVVTPYSSMIVLVTARQERLLDELETQGDRFEREHEDIGETVPVTVTGVPEPEEWLLIALAAAMLIWYARTTQLAPRRQRVG